MKHLDPIILSEVNEKITAGMGLHFPKDRLTDLERYLLSAMPDFAFNSLVAFAQWLLSTKLNTEQIKKLAVHLTIGETYFFRDKINLEVLRSNVIPALIEEKIKKGDIIKIWCAASSTGEEPYSIAIWLKTHFPELNPTNLKIFATDININSLEKAKAGIYKEWSFRDTPGWLKNNYFKKEDKQYLIKPEIKQMVNYFYLNLAEAAYPSILNELHSIDIILCRNVLMYFSREQTRKVIKRLHGSLLNNGWLLVSAVETSQELFSDFSSVVFQGITLYRKTDISNITPDLQLYLPPLANFSPEILPVQIPEYIPNLNEPLISEKIIEPATTPDILKNGYEIAYNQFRQGDYQAAEKLLLEIYPLSENSAAGRDYSDKIITLLIRTYANHRKLDAALLWCEKGITLNKLEPIYYYLLASVYQEKGLLNEAIQALNKVLFLDHDFIMAHFTLGNIYSQAANRKDSAKHFNNALLLLAKKDQNEKIAESDELTAGGITDIIKLINKG